ncbi:hypothetical protein OAS95_01060 [Pelagibacteraceae bacterium]|nr:hypothetical protein [Pelagibacteraceae bacterium]
MDNMIDDEWDSFLSCQNTNDYGGTSSTPSFNEKNITEEISGDVPECEDLYISTTTKVLFLNQPIDIQNIFWKIPITDYWKPESGIIKKQIKIVSKTQEELDEYYRKLEDINYYNEVIIKQIINQDARRIKFKDERKITIGISKKDIMTCRGKVKNAFYNCFALILRFKFQEQYREIHVKVFNTGKLEIPGVLNLEMLSIVKQMILDLLTSYTDSSLEFLEHDIESNVLINSNFNCGFYIDRDKLHNILRSSKYNIETAYDPCSYPGVKCKYYFNHDVGFDRTHQCGKLVHADRTMKMSELDNAIKYSEISFMIFRTGSCLIVGNCTERILRFVYESIKQVLHDEYYTIAVTNMNTETKIKKEKVRKKTILLTPTYYTEVVSK